MVVPIHMACSSARKTACLQLEGTVSSRIQNSYGLSRICFEMTRQARPQYVWSKACLCLADEQHVSKTKSEYRRLIASLQPIKKLLLVHQKELRLAFNERVVETQKSFLQDLCLGLSHHTTTHMQLLDYKVFHIKD
jgi:hypothetical protein